MDTQEYLQKTHQVLKEILDYVAGICDAQGFTYFLAYGTALGARRHSGFIPWDDDIDICMPRNDYEALLRYMKEHPSKEYPLQFIHNEDQYFLYFAKVRKAGTLFREGIVDGLYKENGFFIDIFPMEYVDRDQVEHARSKFRRFHMITHYLMFHSCKELYKEKESGLRYALDCVNTLFYRGRSNKEWIEELQREITGDGTEETFEYIAEFEDRVTIMQKDIFFPPAKLEFEGTLYNVPNQIDEYLKVKYGPDYMQLPPEDQRNTHMPIEVDFGNGGQA